MSEDLLTTIRTQVLLAGAEPGPRAEACIRAIHRAATEAPRAPIPPASPLPPAYIPPRGRELLAGIRRDLEAARP